MGLRTLTPLKGSAAAPPSSLLTDLVSYWKFDETGTATRVDQLGNNDLSNIVGSISDTTGVIGNAIVIPSAARAATAGGSLNPSGSFTFAGWAQFQAITGTQPWIFANIDDSGTNRGYYFTIRSNLFELQLSDDGTTPTFAQATTFGTPSINTWYFLCCGFDQGNSQGFISVNNGTVDTVSFAGPQNAGVRPFAFGQNNGHAADPNWADEWGYWSRVLTPTEVTQLYNSGVGITYPF